MNTSTRRATVDDLAIIQRTLYLALTWDGEPDGMTFDRAMAHDYVLQYHENWGRDGDVGVIAEHNGGVIGAAYGRLFTENRHGHGYLDELTPEIAVAVEPAHTSHGIGTLLLHSLEDAYRPTAVTRLGLSVELANRAMGLYERLGYVEVDRDNDAARMVKDL